MNATTRAHPPGWLDGRTREGRGKHPGKQSHEVSPKIWAAMFRAYLAGHEGIQAIAERFGVNRHTAVNHAWEEEWVLLRGLLTTPGSREIRQELALKWNRWACRIVRRMKEGSAYLRPACTAGDALVAEFPELAHDSTPHGPSYTAAAVEAGSLARQLPTPGPSEVDRQALVSAQVVDLTAYRRARGL